MVLSLVHPSGSQVVPESLQGIQEEGDREEGAGPPPLQRRSSLPSTHIATQLINSPAAPGEGNNGLPSHPLCSLPGNLAPTNGGRNRAGAYPFALLSPGGHRRSPSTLPVKKSLRWTPGESGHVRRERRAPGNYVTRTKMRVFSGGGEQLLWFSVSGGVRQKWLWLGPWPMTRSQRSCLGKSC